MASITAEQEQLFLAAAAGSAKALQELLGKGTDPNYGHVYRPGARDREFLSPLHGAVAAMSEPAVRLLLTHGADANAVSSLERTALDMAEAGPVQRLLLDAGALSRWDLMVREPVIGIPPPRKPPAPVLHEVIVTRHFTNTYTIRDVVTREIVGAKLDLGCYAHVFDAHQRVIWPTSNLHGMYIHYRLAEIGEVWTIRGMGVSNEGGQSRGQVVWLRGLDGFQGGVFFPSRACTLARGAAAAPACGAGGPTPIRAGASVPVGVHCCESGRDSEAEVRYDGNRFLLYDWHRRLRGDDKVYITQEQFLQLAQGEMITHDGFRITPLGPP